ncbi:MULTISPECIES: type 4a pilus biogenesis protein PilO [Hallerella]|uniref:Type IV pilus assembly protein PilO n=1 Tax=Hallerella succinigenes TaxID=1896222 RepID=A0A2M9A4H5_9BACT|nr:MULTISPECIES: type 4a pilus biogenesis protein PilO [Hallerella]MBS7391290.1 type 4a pilus biogenesis protein PilO [Fibrobacter sp.]MCI6874434.1 type 4a pilus biogenesis protein PilO [Hallerella sp.]MDD6092506.1 type 4a pilus biogenesis protein PilO [Hallerella succinigenes]MDY5028688.1 type 4a pilus biogenesis protein PilO [Hallerella succinigenes]PJJ40543.1 type IV pilus assembly protein PilO [Hallerella succinigenes]
MQALNLKDKKTIYALAISLLILAGAYFVYTYMWEPFTLEEQRLESELRNAESELSKINVQKGRIAKLEAELVAAENEFERLKEMFPEEEKVPMRLQDLYAVLRSAGVQIQKFSPGPRTEREYFFEHRYSVAVNAGYHMLGYLFAEIANFNYPTAIADLKISRYSGIKQEIEKAESHGWTPITISVSFNLTTYTSKKVAQ